MSKKNQESQFEDSKWIHQDQFNEQTWNDNMNQWKEDLNQMNNDAPIEIQEAIEDQIKSQGIEVILEPLPMAIQNESEPEKEQSNEIKESLESSKPRQINGWIFLIKSLMIFMTVFLLYVFFVSSEEEPDVKNAWKQGIAPLMWCPGKNGGLIVNVQRIPQKEEKGWEYLIWLNNKHEILKAIPLKGEDLKEWNRQKTDMNKLQKESFMADICREEGAPGVGHWDVEKETIGHLSAIQTISDKEKEGLRMSVFASWNERRKIERRAMINEMIKRQDEEILRQKQANQKKSNETK